MGVIPCYNSVINYMGNSSITQYLYQLVDLTAKPLASVERAFAVDSSGISSPCKDRWIKVRTEYKQHRDYKKWHIGTGVSTNIITSVKITSASNHDNPQFRELLIHTAKTFKLKEVSADKGYLAKKNVILVEELGAKPYIAIKDNTNLRKKGLNAWGRMLTEFQHNKKKFEEHYHKRSNVETTFSMIKRRFNPYLRSKNEKAEENELLCLVICHNLAVLVHSFFELKINLRYLD